MSDRFTAQQVEATAQHLLERARMRLARRDERRRRISERFPEASRLLREEFGARRVILVGSFDQPWFWEGSDVDLVVEGVDPARAAGAERRAGELLEIRVDLLRFEELDPSFRRVVEEEGRQLP